MSQIKKINHIAILVPDMEEAIEIYGQKLGLQYVKEMTSDAYNSRYVFYACGEVLLELIQPLGPSSNADDLKAKGPHIHHMSFEVENIREAMEEVGKTFPIYPEGPMSNPLGDQIFYIEKDSILNIETEFKQPAKQN